MQTVFLWKAGKPVCTNLKYGTRNKKETLVSITYFSPCTITNEKTCFRSLFPGSEFLIYINSTVFQGKEKEDHIMLILETGTWTAINEDRCSEENICCQLQKIILTCILNIYIMLLLECLDNTELIVIQSGISMKSTVVFEKAQPRTAIPGYLLLGQSKSLNSYLNDRWVIRPWGVIISCC